MATRTPTARLAGMATAVLLAVLIGWFIAVVVSSTAGWVIGVLIGITLLPVLAGRGTPDPDHANSLARPAPDEPVVGGPPEDDPVVR